MVWFKLSFVTLDKISFIVFLRNLFCFSHMK